MATKAKQVKGFRETVDGVIGEQVRNATSTWPGMHTHASRGRLDYVSIGPGSAGWGPVRPGAEHQWGIIAPLPPRVEVKGYAAQLAIISVGDRDDALIRSLLVRTPSLPVWSERELDEAEFMDAAGWAQEPSVEVPASLRHIGEEENDLIFATYQAQRAGRTALLHALGEVTEAELTAWSSTGNLIGAVQ